jgi:uncharacterized protein (TIGR02588 family)
VKLPKKNWLEWAVAGISALLIGALVVILVGDALIGEQRQPLLSVEIGEADPRSDGLHVLLTVANASDMAVEQIVVEVEAEPGAPPTEVVVASLPRKSLAEAVVVLPSGSPPPAAARIVSYQVP